MVSVVPLSLSDAGIKMDNFEPKLAWSDLKVNADGLVPVIAQDYQTGEVLMLAYMNEEAFNTTIRIGKMTYYSRSRQELWIKGLTSGHTQYVKSLTADCDYDTILAKVSQVGGIACHDKGIDKILKKVGEEATEIVIAAKNPDNEEVKYEMSDFLYHMMVLMVEKGLTWEDITRELSQR